MTLNKVIFGDVEEGDGTLRVDGVRVSVYQRAVVSGLGARVLARNAGDGSIIAWTAERGEIRIPAVEYPEAA